MALRASGLCVRKKRSVTSSPNVASNNWSNCASKRAGTVARDYEEGLDAACDFARTAIAVGGACRRASLDWPLVRG